MAEATTETIPFDGVLPRSEIGLDRPMRRLPIPEQITILLQEGSILTFFQSLGTEVGGIPFATAIPMTSLKVVLQILLIPSSALFRKMIIVRIFGDRIQFRAHEESMSNTIPIPAGIFRDG